MYSSHQEDDEHYNHSAPEFGMHSKQFDQSIHYTIYSLQLGKKRQ